MTHIKVAESVSPKHPDKVCDQIADAILDAYLAKDPNARSAVEILGGHGLVTVTGEVSSEAHTAVDIESIVTRITGDVEVRVQLSEQSTEIARGVNVGGAGDQGVMHGYACAENDEMVPQEYYLARNLAQFLYEKYPQDGKTQVTLADGQIVDVVASWANVTTDELKELIERWAETVDCTLSTVHYHFNPAGDWSVSGFDADSGLSGRKIVIDNYGPRVPVGGGSFSGKDATKVDRSAAYMARHLATKLLSEREAHEVFVRAAYAIGVVHPVMLTALIDGVEHDLLASHKELFTLQSIIETLNLRTPQFEETAKWGHMGRGFAWDKQN